MAIEASTAPPIPLTLAAMAQLPVVRIRRDKEASIQRRHRWVFSGALLPVPEGLADGDTVHVASERGTILATGHYHPGGSIAVRILDFSETLLDTFFWSERLRQAAALRTSIGLPNAATDCYRLVNAEGDGLPGLIIDIYGAVAVLQTHTTGMARCLADVAAAVDALFKGKLTAIVHRDATSTGQATRHLKGDATEGSVRENGLVFHVNWAEGQKTGFFLDQRDNRALLGSMSKGRDVLNAFCYTGGFSVYALANGAKRVTSIDISERAMGMARRNHVANNLSNDRHELLCGDVFDHLADANDHDLIILDPPAFAKHIKMRHNAVMAYKRLNSAAIEKLRPGGILFTFSCTQVVDRQQFEGAVLAAAIESGREVRVLQRMGHGADHAVSIYHPEGDYLKGLVLHVV